MRKRIFDIAFSLFALILGAPIFLLCALAIKLTSQGPIFYAHNRIGHQGKPFGCWKFRTMYVDAETKLQTLLATNASMRLEWNAYFKLKEDPRVTVVGKWMRKTSLDELPQFWNVLKGEMSLVGPRPLTRKEVDEYLKEKADKILSVKPGLTSFWAVKGRNQLTLEKRIKWELFYVDHRSFWLDLKLVFLTARTLFFTKGSY